MAKSIHFASNKLFYNQEMDYYICPMGQQMNYIGNSKKKTTTGFIQTSKKYQAQNCSNCPLNGSCHKSKGNRIIEVNENLIRQEHRAFELINSEEGIRRRKKDASMWSLSLPISNRTMGSADSCSVEKKKSLLNGDYLQSLKT